MRRSTLLVGAMASFTQGAGSLMKNDDLSSALRETLINHNEDNVVDALQEIAGALNRIADQLKWLGNGDAATTMGAIEALGMHMEKAVNNVADAISIREAE